VGDLGGDAVAPRAGDAGRDARVGEVERRGDGVATRAQLAPADRARRERAGVEAGRELGRRRGGARVHHDRALGEVAVAGGREAADYLHPLQRRGGDAAQVHAAARGGGEPRLAARA
jgi:hypothetical protein